MSSLLRISEAAALAFHTMALLADKHDARFTTQEIAVRLGASSHHLAKVMQRLRKAGLVESVRGPSGGFKLSVQADRVKLLQIYEAIEGPIPDGGCLLDKPPCEGNGCLLGDMVRLIHQQVQDYLANATLTALAQGMAFLKPPD